MLNLFPAENMRHLARQARIANAERRTKEREARLEKRIKEWHDELKSSMDSASRGGLDMVRVPIPPEFVKDEVANVVNHLTQQGYVTSIGSRDITISWIADDDD